MDALPNDLIGVISSLLTVDDILTLSKVYTKLRRLINTTNFWQDKIWSLRPSSPQLTGLTVSQSIDLYRKISTRGFLSTWGINNNGQLGLGDTIIRTIPTRVTNQANVIQVSCGANHTGYVTSGGELYMFGLNYHSQLGFNPPENSQRVPGVRSPTDIETTPRRVAGLTNVLQVSCGGHFTACITLDGQMYTWGNIFTHTTLPLKVSDLQGIKIKQISSGAAHLGAVDYEGNVYLWGSGLNGELGNGKTSSSHPVRNPSLTNIIQVSCGHYFTGLLNNKGEVYMCGNGYYVNLGLGDRKDVYIPTRIKNLPPIKQIACGAISSLFLTYNGDVYTCGAGFLGLGGTDSVDIPRKISNLPKISQISRGYFHSLLVSETGEIYIYGRNSQDELGVGSTIGDILVPQLLPTISNVYQAACGTDYTAVITLNSNDNFINLV